MRQGGGPTVRLCEIAGGGDRAAADAHDTCGAGIYVHQGGSGLFEACQVHHNGGYGIRVEPAPGAGAVPGGTVSGRLPPTEGVDRDPEVGEVVELRGLTDGVNPALTDSAVVDGALNGQRGEVLRVMTRRAPSVDTGRLRRGPSVILPTSILVYVENPYKTTI